jgi:RNA polymerase sigma factor (sigma-70 family)
MSSSVTGIARLDELLERYYGKSNEELAGLFYRGGELLGSEKAVPDDVYLLLFIRHRSRQLGLARLLLGSRRDEAEAVVNITWTRFYLTKQTGKQFDTTRSFKPWIDQILRNEAVNVLRGRIEPTAESPGDLEPDAPLTVDIHLIWALRDCLRELPESERLVVEHKDIKGLTFEETGRKFAIPPGSVPDIRDRAHLRLADCLSQKGYKSVELG